MVKTLYSEEEIEATDLPLAVLKICLMTGFLFALFLFLDFADFFGKIHLPDWLSIGNVDDARALLSAIIGAVSTVLALVFSVVLLVLAMAASQFGPRLLRRFILVQHGHITIGLFSSTFLYSLITLVLVRSEKGVEFVPQLCNLYVALLLIASFVSLIYYCQDVRKGIQTQNLITGIHSDLGRVIAEFIRVRRERSISPENVANIAELRKRCDELGYTVKTISAGYLQHIEYETLLDAAVADDAVIAFNTRPGQFVFADTKIASVFPADKGPALVSLMNKTIQIGSHRTLTQDPEFAIAQIVEVGIRALSPAVNDTYTGIACIDWLCNDILHLVNLPNADAWKDKENQIRLIEPPYIYSGMVATAFDMIRQSGANNPAILIRLLHNFGRMGVYSPSEEGRAALLRQVEAIYEEAQFQHFAKADQQDILKSYNRAKQSILGTEHLSAV